ncbi:hypothetical protein HB825_08640 [Listeria booriae]|nr:hypothetical protein [Listeria booriae]MBC1524086.1 hypothetical protein [Listeria booriae]MBC6134899.1 hypothetical protein [Listeria booriae]
METAAIRALHRFVRMAKRRNIDVKLTYPSTLGFDTYEHSNYLAELKAYLESTSQSLARQMITLYHYQRLRILFIMSIK